MVVSFTSCSKPGPEEVLREWLEAIYAGDCKHAKILSQDSAIDFVHGCIDAGCPITQRQIISLNCTVENNEANCDCKEQYESDPDLDVTTHWTMKISDGEWKVSRWHSEFEFTKHIDE